MNTELFTSHGFELLPSELSQFEKFLELFVAYNTHTNLSAIRDELGIIEKHFVDSLYGVSVIDEVYFHQSPGPSDPGQQREISHSDIGTSHARNDRIVRLLDIGSGGGFPGIPLKIVIPELYVTLLDSVGKKVNAMNHFITELGLTDITAIQERAEILARDHEHAGRYDIIVSRATAYMTDILTWAEPFLAPDGSIILYKMPSEEEKKDIRKISKKLGLMLVGELTYTLGDRERILYRFIRRA